MKPRKKSSKANGASKKRKAKARPAKKRKTAARRAPRPTRAARNATGAVKKTADEAPLPPPVLPIPVASFTF